MALLRTSSRWSARLISQSTRAAQRRPCKQLLREVRRRGYASGGEHSTHKSGSDLPWAIGAVSVTVPSLYYLLQSGPEKSHGHGHGHGEEGHDEHEETEEHGGEAEQGEKAEGEGAIQSSDRDADGEKSEQPTGGDGEKPEGKQDDKVGDSGNEGENQQEPPKTSEDEGSENVAHEKGKGGENVEGVQFKGATSAGNENNEQTDTRKHIPDAKGYNKLRIESDYGKKQGESDEEDGTRDEDGKVIDKAATAKSPKGQHSQSTKQEGLSNTDTKYPFDIANSPDKSTKGEGTPETAKAKGTVDPARPQA